MFLRRNRKTKPQTVVQCAGQFYETSIDLDAVYRYMDNVQQDHVCGSPTTRPAGFIFLDKAYRRPEDVDQFALRVKDIQAVIPSHGFRLSVV